MIKTTGFEYDRMALSKLLKVNKSSKLMVEIGIVIFFIIACLSSLYAYSFDPVLALAVFALMIGNFVIMILMLFIFGKIIFVLRILSGEEL
jgi:hypothetical protein